MFEGAHSFALPHVSVCTTNRMSPDRSTYGVKHFPLSSRILDVLSENPIKPTHFFNPPYKNLERDCTDPGGIQDVLNLIKHIN